jgi:hypothetical protein
MLLVHSQKQCLFVVLRMKRCDLRLLAISEVITLSYKTLSLYTSLHLVPKGFDMPEALQTSRERLRLYVNWKYRDSCTGG